ncbi:MAG: KH domain-containing protein [Sandaracinaceae bacterium]
MDFKVCGTSKGVTAIQMDIKISGLSREIMEQALDQAKEARLHILDKMLQAIPAPREELNKWAPRITSIKVKPDQIRLVIGPGGKMIRAIQDQSGAQIDVEDDGTVNVASPDSEAVAKALELIRGLTEDAEIATYKGIVKGRAVRRVRDHAEQGRPRHISDFDWERVDRTEDVMNLGDTIEVQVTDIDDQGRIRLSRKVLPPSPRAGGARGRAPRSARGAR